MKKLILPAIVAAAFAMPASVQAKPFTCPNPAICKAVCGKTTCGKLHAGAQTHTSKPTQAVRIR